MLFMGKSRFESRPLLVRLLLWPIVIAAGAFVTYLSISYVAIPTLVSVSTTFNPTLYRAGLYGGAPLQRYLSCDLTSPRISVQRHDDQCEESYTFLNFNGDSMEDKGPAILDARNELVWLDTSFATTTNLKVQTYQGKQYLTFWSGEKGGTNGEEFAYRDSEQTLT
jgi:hypothetical protein